ncbi:DUF2993 domain-containing protein [Streptomyces venezuelae]|uniref:LmeA family phospholipid-binding protein n=1 Tax=Streptomyces venezuelae TaxID=54571 RepID=UPI002958A358|nr:DUF2993 domain-containing protein [Streptomyces venezuelae]
MQLRLIRVLLIIGLVLVGLLVAADRIAVGYAEDKMAEKVRTHRAAIDGTEVDISGFPFLTQALGHRLDRVDVHLKGVEATADGRRMRIARLDSRFHDVKLNGDYTGGTAERADGSALVTYEDLTKASTSGATVTYGGSPGKVKVTATVDLLGRSITRSVISTITLVDGSTVRVRADEVPGGGIPGLEELVRSETDFDRRLDGGLPAGLKLSALTSDQEGVHLTVSGSKVDLAG